MAVSPDGGTLAFTTGNPGQGATLHTVTLATGTEKIWTPRAVGAPPQLLLQGPAHHRETRW